MSLTLEQLLEQGIAAHRAGKFQDAERHYRTILESDPTHCHANHNLGVLAVRFGQIEQSLPYFKVALKTDPKQVQFWLSYIEALIKLERLDDARVILEQGKRAGLSGEKVTQFETQLNASSEGVVSSDAGPQQLLGLYNQGRLEEALKLGVSLSQQHPNDANIPNILGAVETARGNYAEAIALYNKAIKLKPGRADFYNNLGAVLKKSGNPNLALSHYLKAIDIKTDFVEVYNNLGAILLEFPDRNEDEIFYLKKALILRPDYDNARNNLAVAFCNLGCLEEAEAQLQIGSFEAPRSFI